MLPVVPIAVPAVIAVVYLVAGWTRGTRWLAAVAAGSVLVCGLVMPPYQETLSGALRVDPLAKYLVIVVGAVAVLALAGLPSQLRNDMKDRVVGPVTTRWYGVLAMVVLAAAVVAAVSAAVVVALAATGVVVVALTGLVASRGKPPQKRAAVAFGASCAAGVVVVALSSLVEHGPTATVLAVLGWATLAGLAPVHWWLPTTMSVVSAPFAVLIVGVQAPLAWTPMLRLASSLGEPARELLTGAALASLVVAGVALARQRDVRRMVAYLGLAGSGLLALSVVVGAESVGMRVMLCLGLNAAVLYLTAGHIVSLTGTGRIATARGLLTRNLLLGEVLGLGLFVAAVLIPAVFLARVFRLADGGAATVGIAVAAGLAVVAVLVGRHAWPMLTGDPADRADVTAGPARPLGSATPVLIAATALAILVPITPNAIPADVF